MECQRRRNGRTDARRPSGIAPSTSLLSLLSLLLLLLECNYVNLIKLVSLLPMKSNLSVDGQRIDARWQADVELCTSGLVSPTNGQTRMFPSQPFLRVILLLLLLRLFLRHVHLPSPGRMLLLGNLCEGRCPGKRTDARTEHSSQRLLLVSELKR